ncbi:MAG TPA: hypothetical protein VGO67_05480 [Verrucomicrobiae bacterium]|jgi:hypothetical protein
MKTIVSKSQSPAIIRPDVDRDFAKNIRGLNAQQCKNVANTLEQWATQLKAYVQFEQLMEGPRGDTLN